MQDACLTMGALRRCALRRRSHGLRGFYKLMSTLLTLVTLLSPDMTALDTLWLGAFWALHGAGSDKTYFYYYRMLKISTVIER